MILSKNGIVPPDKWYHKPELFDHKGNTVSINLSKNGIIPE